MIRNVEEAVETVWGYLNDPNPTNLRRRTAIEAFAEVEARLEMERKLHEDLNKNLQALGKGELADVVKTVENHRRAVEALKTIRWHVCSRKAGEQLNPTILMSALDRAQTP